MAEVICRDFRTSDPTEVESASLRSIEAWREAALEMHGDFTMISYFPGKKNMNMDSDASCLFFLVHFFRIFCKMLIQNPKSI